MIVRTSHLDVPGLPAGTKFNTVGKEAFNNAPPRRRPGHIGSSADTTSAGIFRWDNGVLTDMALDGEAAPGTNSTFDFFLDAVHTDADGNLMFAAELADDSTGVWYVAAGTDTPVLQLLTGQMVDVFGDGTDIRLIADIAMTNAVGGPQVGGSRLMNDNGDFLVQLDFAADGTARDIGGLYISSVVVPEQTTLAVTMVGSVLVLRR